MALQVIEPGFLTTVQDLGRQGYERFGVPVSGAMDAFALRAANQLAGNPIDAAVLEFAMIGPVIQTREDCLVALTGVGFELSVTQPSPKSKPSTWACPAWTAVWVSKDAVLSPAAAGDSGWGYLAVSGGIDVPQVLGSRSTYLRGQFGGFKGRKLEAGDVVQVLPAEGNYRSLAGRTLPLTGRPAYNSTTEVEVILGPQSDHFTRDGMETFLGSEYQVSLLSDRMGYRLAGPPIEHSTSADILTDGIALGSIQVPANGQPIVALSDRQTTGGYAKIATVISADLPVLVQCPLGKGRIRFKPTTVQAAQYRLRTLFGKLDRIAEE